MCTRVPVPLLTPPHWQHVTVLCLLCRAQLQAAAALIVLHQVSKPVECKLVFCTLPSIDLRLVSRTANSPSVRCISTSRHGLISCTNWTAVVMQKWCLCLVKYFAAGLCAKRSMLGFHRLEQIFFSGFSID